MMTKPLSNIQREILQSFNYELNEGELLSFKNMLAEYFANKISDDVDELFDREGWTEEKNNEWSSTHMRTPYNSGN